MFINIGDFADGVLISAIGAAGRRIATAVTGRRGASDLDIARWVPDLPAHPDAT